MIASVISTASAIPTIPIGTAGQRMPLVSLGTGSGQHGDVSNATGMWLQVGGSGIDTAYDYHDEKLVAAGVKAVGASWSSIFLTTKIPCATTREAQVQALQPLHLPQPFPDIVHPRQEVPFLQPLQPMQLLPRCTAAPLPRCTAAPLHRCTTAPQADVASNLAALGVGTVDLLLIHGPRLFGGSGRCSVAETWVVLEAALAAGQARRTQMPIT